MSTGDGASGYRSARRNPWWIPPFLGGVPNAVEPAHLRVLGLVTFAMFFENYDIGMLGNALPQIARSFELDKAALGDFTGWTRLGAIPAFLILPLADRLGRRRLLLVSVAAMSLGSFATAFAQTPVQFVIAQIATRTFILTATMVSLVVIAEELPAAHRGWGIGILAGVGAIGYGFGAAVYAAVGVVPYGWRSLYALGLLPLFALPALARNLKETQRFAARAVHAAGEHVLASLVALVRKHPARALAIGAIGLFDGIGTGVAFQFISEYQQTVRGWTPGRFAALSIFFGAFAIVGNPIAGRLGDRFGRRSVAAAVLALFPLTALAFYAGPASLAALPWTAMVFLSMAATVCVRALATELFPTEARGSAGGGLILFETVGVAIGLFLYRFLMEAQPRQDLVIPLISSATWIAALCIVLVPETAGRDLDELHSAKEVA